MIDQEGDNLPKPETDWTANEAQSSNYNSKALNAIFTTVDTNMFSLITNRTSAKSACDIFQRHCEGSESVRRTRLRMLTSKFEMMRIIGDSISNERLVSKVLRSLPERFNIKICAIEEAKDTSQMALEDLISSLRTFEMNLDMQKKDKGKTIALQASNESYNELLQISQEVNDSDLCEDSISLITKKFGDYLKRIRDKKKDTQPSKFSSLHAPERSQKYPAKQQSQPRNEGYNVSLSDEESDAEEKSTDEENQTSLSIIDKKSQTADWTKRNKLNSSLMKENTDLKAVVAKLEVMLSKKDLEPGNIKEELQKATETLSKFNSSTSKLETILSMGRDDKKGLGFKDSVHEIGESSTTTVFVKGKTETFTPPESTPSTKRFPPKRQPTAHVTKKRKRRDNRMNQNLSQMLPQMLHNTFRNTPKNRPTVRQVWVPKVQFHCNVVYTSLKTNTAGYWYFDSGNSRYMTGSRDYLIDYVEQKGGRVTYVGGAKRKIVGNGTLNIEGLPKLHNVLHVEGLTSNLISISQLCYDNLHVKFNKNVCEVFDESNICIMTGTRSSDNCYQIGEELSCKQAQITELDLWHQKLDMQILKP
ncbi:uncharacterized protein LOC142550246 [Primulina tabacum]|uniref:uncharacterized protein LOC142550246 n=1 Tax=Primulina tabacum TaxID=48773 RepID=UPI003F59DC57